uniref:PH domain-containing protein n=1 Tax=Echinostoma caproni TaxID=27848 RepID=A0A183AFI8_9TREM
LRTMRLDVDNWGELVLHGHFRVAGKKDLRLVLLFHRAILLCKYTRAAPQLSQYSATSASASADQVWFSSTSAASSASASSATHANDLASSNASLPGLGYSISLTTVHIREIISCANLMLVECIPKDALAFHILPFDNPKAQRTLQAPTLEVKRLWCREIKRLILENYDAAIPEKAKHIVLNMAELSTAHGLLDPSGLNDAVLKGSGCGDQLAGSPLAKASPPTTVARTQTLDRVNTAVGNTASGPWFRSRTGERKQRYSDTTVPGTIKPSVLGIFLVSIMLHGFYCLQTHYDPNGIERSDEDEYACYFVKLTSYFHYIALKKSSAYSLFEPQSSLQESPQMRSVVPNSTPKTPESLGDASDGLDAVFHDVWNKYWSKHSSSTNQDNGSTTTQNSFGRPNSPAGSPSKVPLLCDTDTDFRCIAVEINEERLGVEVPLSTTGQSHPKNVEKPCASEAPPSMNNGQLTRRRTDISRPHKAPAPQPPESPQIPQTALTRKSDNPNHSQGRPRISSVYIDCPSASCYDVVTFGRAYEHYIAKARAQVALSPRDLDEIFSPLRELAQSFDTAGAPMRAATVPLSGNVEATELRLLMHNQRAATAERDPFFYRHTSPVQSLTQAGVQSEFIGDVDNASADNNDGEEDDKTSSHGSSGASSPRHLVSRIAISGSRSALATEMTKTIVVQPACNDSTKSTTTCSMSSATTKSQRLFGLNKANSKRTDSFWTGTRSSNIHTGLLSSPRRQKATQSSNPHWSEDDLSNVELSKNLVTNGSKDLSKWTYEYKQQRGSKMTCEQKNSITPVRRSSFIKPRSISTVNNTYLTEPSDMSCIGKPSGRSQPPSPPTEELSCLTKSPQPVDDSLLSRGNRRKSRTAPPPPSSISTVSRRVSFNPSDRAPLAQVEATKDLDLDVSVCRGQMRAAITRLADALPYADDASSTPSARGPTDLVSSVPKFQPIKPPRRNTLGSANISRTESFTTDWARSSRNNGGNGNGPTKSTTNGLSPLRTNTSSLQTGPRRGTVRTMIDRFQR